MKKKTKPAPKRGLTRIWRAFLYSVRGLLKALAGETAFQQEVSVYCFLLVVLLFLPLSLTFKLILFMANTLVLIAELLNSAIESAVDIISPDYHPLAERAKDMGSAAVFVSIIAAFILWGTAVFQILRHRV